VLVVGVLWAAKTVLLPLALGVILAFALTPLVRVFDSWHLPRVLGVALTMLLALGAVGGIGYVVVNQFADLSSQVTRYTSSMRQKVAQLRMGDDAALRQLTRTVNRVTEQLDDNAADLRSAQPVRVVPPRPSAMDRVRDAAGSVFEPIASTIIVLVLVAFMLGQREDLRDRFIRLIGADNVTLTTRAMDDAGQRVSQFLVWQTLINLVFGTLVAAGLYWIGVPYAALWGGLTAVLRFVPYVGAFLSALIPATLAFAIFPGWAATLQVLAMFLAMDMVTAWFAEPLVFGPRTGVSSFALLVSALFWIWVWGPVGLLLSTPLTVCIAVLGRHVRSLRFLATIFADEPALTPGVRFYQRLLARDESEASSLVSRKLQELGPAAMVDDMLIPAVLLALQHRAADEITREDAAFVLDFAAEALDDIPAVPAGRESHAANALAVTTHAAADRLLLRMFGAALRPQSVELVEPRASEDAADLVIERRPGLVCVVSISPSRGSEVRNYCRRIRGALPNVKILVLRPLLADAEPSRSDARLKEAGVDVVVTRMRDAAEALTALLGAQSQVGLQAVQSERAAGPVAAGAR
jgi:predicted PurR-regulated permease PerM